MTVTFDVFNATMAAIARTIADPAVIAAAAAAAAADIANAAEDAAYRDAYLAAYAVQASAAMATEFAYEVYDTARARLDAAAAAKENTP